MKIEPITLEGDFVRLEPLCFEHLENRWKVGADETLWRWTGNVITSFEEMKRYVETALDEQRRGVSLPFVTIEKSGNKIIGSTRFANIDRKNRRAEIGWTWINPKWQRTFINTEAKFLMLRHAFETWNCIRVELKTDALNEQSRNAILRIGAKEEGIFRRHLITDTGRIRNTVYFSILDSEWQKVKENLQSKLSKKYF
ncbi:MAG: GNAT family N-acetyltransferase [Pyrinomonadaceae bacterium]